MARFFCGPDDSEWVSQDFTSPEATLATFREAFRRDNPDGLYLSLSEDLKRSYGLDGMTAQVGYEELKNQVTGVHLLGTAEVSEPELHDGFVRFFLSAPAGYTFRVDVKEYAFWEVRVSVPKIPEETYSAYVQDLSAWFDVSELQAGGSGSLLVTSPLQLEAFGLLAEDIDGVRFAKEWKVLDFQPVEDDS